MESNRKWQLLQKRILEEYVSEAIVFARELDIEFLLIKGWLAAQNYEHPEDRLYSDIDFIVAPEQYDKIQKLLTSFKGKLNIDLHKGARHLDSISYKNLHENSRLMQFGKTFVRVPRPEDHLRILCVHWLNDGGARKDRLWDIYYAVANRPNDFDWDRCLKSVSATRRRWIVCTIGLAHKYLNLDVRDTPIANEIKDIPIWLLRALEKEWKSEVRLLPLKQFFYDRQQFWRQLKKRIPPNPIQATIEMEGEFDDRTRVFYQVGDILLRSYLSIKRTLKNE